MYLYLYIYMYLYFYICIYIYIFMLIVTTDYLQLRSHNPYVLVTPYAFTIKVQGSNLGAHGHIYLYTQSIGNVNNSHLIPRTKSTGYMNKNVILYHEISLKKQ